MKGTTLGLSTDKLMLYGLPHINAHYFNKSYERDESWCCVCGKPASNCHHVVPRRNGHEVKRETEYGTFILRSPLIVVCGSGTTGCHGDIHRGKLKVTWKWDEKEWGRLWEDGTLLSMHGPHSPDFYYYGQWQFEHADGWVKLYRERW